MKKFLQVIALSVGAFIAAVLVTMLVCSFVLPMRLGGDSSFRGKYGYLNRDCKLVIPARFERAFPFREGLAAVSLGSSGKEKFGFIDHSGKFVIEPAYGWAHSFSEGLACVLGDQKYGFIDPSGHFVITPRFDDAWPFSDGLARVRSGNAIGFVDHKGKWILKVPSGWKVLDFSQGLAPVSVDKKQWGFIDKTGTIVVKPIFDRIWWNILPDYPVLVSFSEGLSGVCMGEVLNEKWGFIDKKGHYIAEPQFQEIRSFQDGLAPVCTGNARDHWGYINKLGQMVIKPVYGFAFPFCEGLAAVNAGSIYSGSWGFIDHDGRWVIPPKYDTASSFSDGLAAVTFKDPWWDLSNRRGLIDKTGNRHCEVPDELDGLTVLTDAQFIEGLSPAQIAQWIYKGKVIDPAKMKQERLFARLLGIFPAVGFMLLTIVACIFGFGSLYGYIKRKRGLP